MVKDEVVGTYWYVFNNGERWITQGNKPIPSGDYFQRSGEGMNWLCLDRPDCATKNGIIMDSTDYMNINFPDIPPNNPVEIEIVKSGRVYVYEF